jgi:protein phosphatase 1L
MRFCVCRAIGDVSLQPYVTCEPEIEKKELTEEDEYLVLATDGVWDVLSNDQVAKLIRNTAPRGFLECAKVLCSEALIMGSTDNVTVVVIDLR